MIFTDRETVHQVDKIGYVEGLPVVVNPGIIDPKQFIDEVLNIRIPNPFMPDTPQRIVTDISQKLGIRFGETIKAYIKRDDLSVDALKLIPLVFAGWCRYLMAIDDQGNAMALSSDPLLDEVTPYLSSIALGDKGSFHEQLKPILETEPIKAAEGVVRHVLAYNDNLMCVENRFEAGAIGSLHAQPHTQITYIVSGE